MNSSNLNRYPVTAILGGIILLAALMTVPMTSAFAEVDDINNFSLSVGFFVADRENGTRIDASNGDRGTEVDLEDDLGLESTNRVFRIDGYYRFNDTHRIDFSWFDLSRSATNIIDKDIQWNDTLFRIDMQIDSIFDLDIYKVAYTWSFMRREKGFLGLTAGLYIMDFSTTLAATTLGARESAGTTAPLPVVGLRGKYELSERWSLRASSEVFAYKFDESDGLLIDVYAGVDYQLSNRTAIGAGLNAVKFDIDFTLTDFTGNVDWGYAGALVFLKFDF